MKFAIIGCGLMGRKRWQSLPSGCSAIWFCDANAGTAMSLFNVAKEGCWSTSIETLLQDAEVNAVIVATPNSSLSAIAVRAMKAGKHVFVEKPGGISEGEIDDLILTSERTGSHCKIGYTLVHHPAIEKAAQLVNENSIGTVMFVKGTYGHGGRVGYENEWRMNSALSGGGELIDQGIHLIDLSIRIIGQRLDVAHAHLEQHFWRGDSEDNAFLHLKSRQHQTAWLHASCTEWKNQFQLDIYGRSGRISIAGLGGSYGVEALRFYPMKAEMGPPESITWEYPNADNLAFKREMEDFVLGVDQRRDQFIDLKRAKDVLRIVREATFYSRMKQMAPDA